MSKHALENLKKTLNILQYGLKFVFEYKKLTNKKYLHLSHDSIRNAHFFWQKF